MLGFIADNTIYDILGRYQVGDNLSKGFTKAQRFFSKLIYYMVDQHLKRRCYVRYG